MKKLIPRSIKKKAKSLIAPITTIKDLDNAELIKTYSFSPSKVAILETTNMPLFPNAQYLQGNVYSIPNTSIYRLNDVLYYPKYNMLLTKDRRIILDSLSTNKNYIYDAISPSDLAKLYQKPQKISGCSSVFRSNYNDYYHTLIDNMPRAFLLAQKELENYPQINLLFPNRPSKVERFYLDKLLPQNIKIQPLDPNFLYSLEEVIFPNFITQEFCGYLPSTYIEYFASRVLPKSPRQHKNLIYVSRPTDTTKNKEKMQGIEIQANSRLGKGRIILNEIELVRELEKYGFEQYILEEMTIEAQIDLFYNASYVVAAHGAGLSNIIFSKNIRLLELFPTQFVVPHYYFLAKSMGHDYDYLCHQEEYIHADFKIDLQRVREIISNHLSVVY